ncbi:MAG: hypothetical protein VXV96_05195 [Bdellovibrionota bacterium]|nr:hypothetical protein [Bdellovibrionota bacterium]
MKTKLAILIIGAQILNISASDVGLNPTRPIEDFFPSPINRAKFDPCDILKGQKSVAFEWQEEAPMTPQSEIIINKIMDNLARIIDLKGKVTTYLEENRETYGRYISLKEQKTLLSSRVLRLEEKREKLKSEAQANIARIDSGHSNRKIRKIIEAINASLNSEVYRIDKDLNPAKAQKLDVENEYFEVLSRWAPYKEYLKQLEHLEQNLLKSLAALKEVEEDQSTPSSSSRTFRELNDFTRVVTIPTGFDESGLVNTNWLEKLKERCN